MLSSATSNLLRCTSGIFLSYKEKWDRDELSSNLFFIFFTLQTGMCKTLTFGEVIGRRGETYSLVFFWVV